MKNEAPMDWATTQTRGAVTTRIAYGYANVPREEAWTFLRKIFPEKADAMNWLFVGDCCDDENDLRDVSKALREDETCVVPFLVLLPRLALLRGGSVEVRTAEDLCWLKRRARETAEAIRKRSTR